MANFDDLWGTSGETTLEVQDSFLIDGGGSRYVSPVPFTGSPKVFFLRGQVRDGNPTGLWYKLDGAPDNFRQAALKAVQAKKAEKKTVQHANRDVYEYVRPVNALYFVLAHGTPAQTAIFNDPTKQLGLAAGERSVFFEDGREKKINRGTRLAFLAVEKTFYDFGYVDESGLPIPVLVQFKGMSSNELYTALRYHVAVLKRGMELGLTSRQAQYFAYGIPLVESSEPKEHGQSEVYPILSGHPDMKNITLEYLESIFAGETLFRQMFGMVYEKDSNGRPVPGGLAIEWCKEYIQSLHKNVEEFTGPDGQRPAWGSNPAPMWYTERDNMKNAAMWNPDALRRSSGGSTQTQSSPVAQQPSKLDAAKKDIRMKLAFFKFRNDTEGLALVATALAIAENAMDVSEGEVLNDLKEVMAEMANRQKQIMDENPM